MAKKTTSQTETRENLLRKYPILGWPSAVVAILRAATDFVAFFATLFYGYFVILGLVYFFVGALMRYFGLAGSPSGDVVAWISRVVAILPAFIVAYLLDREVYGRPFQKLAEIEREHE